MEYRKQLADDTDAYEFGERDIAYAMKETEKRESESQPVELYFEFTNTTEKEKAKTALLAYINQPTSGPDYHPDQIFDPKWFIGIDRKPDQRPEGLEFSFSRTPAFIRNPERLKNYLEKFLLNNFAFKLRSRDGRVEDYEVVDNKPV